MALKDLYRIEKGERGWILGIAVSMFLLTAGSLMLARLLEAFVIKRIGVGFLPWLYIVSAIVAFLGSWVTLRVFRESRASSQSVFFGILATVGAFGLAFTQELFTPDKSPAFNFLFVVVGVLVGTLAVTRAISKMRVTMGDVFTYEQMGRLTPVFSSSLTLGVLAGGLLLAGFSEHVSLRGMYLMAAAVLALSLPAFALVQHLIRSTGLERSPVRTEGPRGWLEHLTLKPYITNARLRRFLMMLGLIVGLSVVFGRIFGYALDIVANERFATESALNGFFGTYTVVLSIGALIFINVFQDRLFKRYGLTNNLYTPPLVVLVASLAMFFYPLFWIVVITAYLREIVIGVQEVAYDAVLEGVSDYHRDRAWSWARGPVSAGFDLAGSLLLLGIGFLILPQGVVPAIRVLAILAVAFLLIRFLLTMRFKKAYPAVLLDNLKSGDFKTRLRAMEAMAEMRYMEERHLGEVLDIIRDEEEPSAIRVTALRSVAKIQDPSALRVIARFIDHPDLSVRREAVRTIAAFSYDPDRLYESGFSRHTLIRELHDRFPEEEAAEVVNAIIDALIALRDDDVVPFLIEEMRNRSPEIRHSVLHSLRHFRDPAMIDYVKPFLDDPVPHVRSQAIAAIWQFPWERQSYLRDAIQDLLKAEPGSEDRRQGLYLVGGLHLRRYRKELREALRSEDDEARRSAAIALIKLGDQTGAPELRRIMRGGEADEAYEVIRLADHRDVPEKQQTLITSWVHQYHLHYPPDLPVSEPLRVRMRDIPKGCLEGLLAYYTGPEAADDRRKIEAALHKGEDFPDPEGRVVLVGLPDPWREMAAIALQANGFLVREASQGEAIEPTSVVVADVRSEDFPERTVMLVDRAEGLTEFQVVKSHYAPSELVTVVKKLAIT